MKNEPLKIRQGWQKGGGIYDLSHYGEDHSRVGLN